jgi:hypothetical protein
LARLVAKQAIAHATNGVKHLNISDFLDFHADSRSMGIEQVIAGIFN